VFLILDNGSDRGGRSRGLLGHTLRLGARVVHAGNDRVNVPLGLLMAPASLVNEALLRTAGQRAAPSQDQYDQKKPAVH
jgi:hypothetical protein